MALLKSSRVVKPILEFAGLCLCNQSQHAINLCVSFDLDYLTLLCKSPEFLACL